MQRRTREWVTENKSRILNEQDVNSVVSRIRTDEFVLLRLVNYLLNLQMKSSREKVLLRDFRGKTWKQVGDYFDQTTSKAREDYARENVQPIIQEELKAADFQIRKITLMDLLGPQPH